MPRTSLARPGRLRRKARRNPRRPRNRRFKRSGGSKPQVAHITETIEFVDFAPNTMYLNAFNLAQFHRAQQLAKHFRYYKPTRVVWNYEPLYNTFQEDPSAATSNPGVPYMYTTMNRTQNNHVGTLVDVQAMGATPRKLTGKVTMSYKPNWCSSGLLIQGQTNNSIVGLRSMGQKAEWGWLQCPVTASVTDGSFGPTPAIPSTVTANTFYPQTGLTPVMTQDLADQVLFNGHDLYIDQANGLNTNRIARCSCTVHWSFKGANSEVAVATPNLVALPPA